MRMKWIAGAAMLAFVLSVGWIWIPKSEAICVDRTNAPGKGEICQGISTDSPGIPFTRYEIPQEGNTSTYDRYYYWLGQKGPLRGMMLSSHHSTVESGLSSKQIQNGDVSLDDTKGVYCVAIVGCLND